MPSPEQLRLYFAKHPVLDDLEHALRVLGVTSPRVAEWLLAMTPAAAVLTMREAGALLARWYEACDGCGRLLAWTPAPADRARTSPAYWRHLSVNADNGHEPRPLMVDADGAGRPRPMHVPAERCDCVPPEAYARAAAQYHCAALGQDQPILPWLQSGPPARLPYAHAAVGGEDR